MHADLFVYLSLVAVLGVASQWLAWRLRLPSILLLLGCGVLLGRYLNPDQILSELTGAEDGLILAANLLFPFVSLSVAVILFEGGLTLRLHELKTAGRAVFLLVTVGVLVSWVLTTLAAWQLLHLSLRVSLLLGAILVVTGPTVVAPLLRHIRPVRQVASLVKWEGIVIDPIGAVLAVLVFEELLAHGTHAPLGEMGLLLLRTAVIGGLLGAGAGLLLVHVVMRYWIPDFLHGVVFLATAIGVFAASNFLQDESGLVTVTVLGIVLANQKAISIHHVVEFKEHLGVFLISCLFIVLGSRLDPADLLQLGGGGAAFLAVLILVVRPLSVLIAMWRTKLTWQEKTFLAFMAPRGIVAAAVTSVFALKLATQASENPELVRQAEALVPITFLVIVGTVAVYGLLAAPLARYLNLADTNPQGVLFAGGDPWIRKLATMLQEEGIQVFLVDTNFRHVAAARMEGIPAECASILSEEVREEFDLFGIGRLLAMTPNDEVNALAVQEFAHAFGRKNVYQLAPWDDGAGRRTSLPEHQRGRILFHHDMHYAAIQERLQRGETFKRSNLTETFRYDDFRTMYGDSARVLFALYDGGRLFIATADDPTPPKSSEVLISLVAQAPAVAADQAIPGRRTEDAATEVEPSPENTREEEAASPVEESPERK